MKGFKSLLIYSRTKLFYSWKLCSFMDEYGLMRDSDSLEFVRQSSEGIRGEIPVCGSCELYGSCSCVQPYQRAESCYVPRTYEKEILELL